MEYSGDIKEIDLIASVGLSSPHPFALLVSKSDDIINVMGISWFTFVSLKPGMMAFAISNKGYTKELLNENPSVSLCLPVEKIKKEAFACGTQTGREINKAAELDIELTQVEGFPTPVIADAAVSWILEVSNTVAVGDHTLYIAAIKKIVGTSEENKLYAFDGYKRLDSI